MRRAIYVRRMETEAAEFSRLDLVQALNRVARDCDDASRGLRSELRSVDDAKLALTIAANAHRLAAFRTQLHALVRFQFHEVRRMREHLERERLARS